MVRWGPCHFNLIATTTHTTYFHKRTSIGRVTVTTRWRWISQVPGAVTTALTFSMRHTAKPISTDLQLEVLQDLGLLNFITGWHAHCFRTLIILLNKRHLHSKLHWSAKQQTYHHLLHQLARVTFEIRELGVSWIHLLTETTRNVSFQAAS
jgi:hypothetical protein